MSDEREGREGEEEAEVEAEAQEGEEEAAEEVVDENQELLAKVPDPHAMTGTIDTSGAAAKLVSEQMETITPSQMADSGHTEELREIAEGAEEASEEGGEEAPEEPAEDE